MKKSWMLVLLTPLYSYAAYPAFEGKWDAKKEFEKGRQIQGDKISEVPRQNIPEQSPSEELFFDSVLVEGSSQAVQEGDSFFEEAFIGLEAEEIKTEELVLEIETEIIDLAENEIKSSEVEKSSLAFDENEAFDLQGTELTLNEERSIDSDLTELGLEETIAQEDQSIVSDSVQLVAEENPVNEPGLEETIAQEDQSIVSDSVQLVAEENPANEAGLEETIAQEDQSIVSDSVQLVAEENPASVADSMELVAEENRASEAGLEQAIAQENLPNVEEPRVMPAPRRSREPFQRQSVEANSEQQQSETAVEDQISPVLPEIEEQTLPVAQKQESVAQEQEKSTPKNVQPGKEPLVEKRGQAAPGQPQSKGNSKSGQGKAKITPRPAPVVQEKQEFDPNESQAMNTPSAQENNTALAPSAQEPRTQVAPQSSRRPRAVHVDPKNRQTVQQEEVREIEEQQEIADQTDGVVSHSEDSKRQSSKKEAKASSKDSSKHHSKKSEKSSSKSSHHSGKRPTSK